MNLIQLLKDHVNLYPSFNEYLKHKLTHVSVGLLIGILAKYNLIFSLTLLVVVAIGKEILDHYALLEDPTNPIDQLKYHVIDVVITILGGFLGFIIVYLT